MTTNPYDRTSGTAAGTGSASKKDAAKDEAGNLKNEAAGSGQHVKETAKDQATAVKEEASDQAKDLFGQLKNDIDFGRISSDFGRQVQERAASTVRACSDEIDALSRGEKPETDYVTGLLNTANQQVRTVASSLENKQPGELVDEVRRFAARRPGAFLAAALGIGLLAGRVTRSAKDSDEIGSGSQDSQYSPGVSGQAGQGTPAVATGTVYDQGYGADLASTGTSGYTPGDPYAYRSDEQGEAARTYTDPVPGTVYPDQEGDRR